MWNIPRLVDLTCTRDPNRPYALETELQDRGCRKTEIDISLQSLSSGKSPWHQGLEEGEKKIKLVSRLSLVGRMMSDRRESEILKPSRRGISNS